MLNGHLSPLPIFLGLLLATLSLLHRYRSGARHHRIRVLLFPLLLGACAVAAAAVGARRSYGGPAASAAPSGYVAHRTLLGQGEKRWIEVRLLARKTPAADAGLYRS
jgi:hypothetical protein